MCLIENKSNTFLKHSWNSKLISSRFPKILSSCLVKFSFVVVELKRFLFLLPLFLVLHLFYYLLLVMEFLYFILLFSGMSHLFINQILLIQFFINQLILLIWFQIPFFKTPKYFSIIEFNLLIKQLAVSNLL